jgi:hypothetical protein
VVNNDSPFILRPAERFVNMGKISGV